MRRSDQRHSLGSLMPLESIQPIPRRRWRIGWLLGLGVLVNYFDRVNLSVSQAALFTAFGISSITFGYLSSAYNLDLRALPASHRCRPR